MAFGLSFTVNICKILGRYKNFKKICHLVTSILYDVLWPKGRRQNLVVLFSVGRAQESWATKNRAGAWSRPFTPGRGGLSNYEYQLCIQMTRRSPTA